jgi:hypothetical protein
MCILTDRYQFAYWAALWAPEVGMNSSHWQQLIIKSEPKYQLIKKKKHASTCGVCMDCLDGNFDIPHVAPPPGAPRLRIVGVDLNGRNILIQNKIQDMLQSESSLWSSRINLELIHAGASNFTGSMKTPVCAPGYEDCSLTSSQSRTNRLMITTEIVTVDSVVENLKSKNAIGKGSIDMLLIDTEGNDALVIEGALNTIREGLVRCLIFEYHYRGFWQQTSLNHVTQSLEQFGYQCYLSAIGALWPVNKGMFYA